jgi:hypothetical protein
MDITTGVAVMDTIFQKLDGIHQQLAQPNVKLQTVAARLKEVIMDLKKLMVEHVSDDYHFLYNIDTGKNEEHTYNNLNVMAHNLKYQAIKLTRAIPLDNLDDEMDRQYYNECLYWTD